MRFDNTPANETLMRQLPTWFKPVLEYIELMKAFGVSFDSLNENSKNIYYNQYIQTADLSTIKTWEKLFGITVRYGDTIEFRRARLIQKFNYIIPYTYWNLKEQLTELFGDDYTLQVDPVNCWIKIFVTSDRYGAIDLLYDLIWDVVPAHLRVYANQEVTNNVQSGAYLGSFFCTTFVQTISPEGN